MANTATQSRQGFPFAAILTLIFVVAKIAGFIKWSWWLVFAPMWGGLLAVLAIVIVFFVIAVIVAATR